MFTILDTCPNRMPHEMLSAWLDGELDAATARRVQAHVSTCTACQHYLAEVRQGDRALRQHTADDMQAPIWQQLTQKMQRPALRGKPRTTGIVVGGLGAALMLVVLVIGFLALAPNKQGTTQSQLVPTATINAPTAMPTVLATHVPTATAMPTRTPTLPRGKWTTVPGLAFALNGAFAPGDPLIGYACGPASNTNSVLKWSITQDGGQTWSAPAMTGIQGPMCTIVISPTNAQAVAITAIDCGGCSYALGAVPSYVSYNGGQTWKLVAPPAGKVNPAHAGTNEPCWVGNDLYVQVFGNFGVAGEVEQGPYLEVSHNGAPFVWANDVPLLTAAAGTLEWEDLGLGTSLYVLIQNSPGANNLFVTADGGATWQARGTFPNYSAIYAGLDGTTLYAASNGIAASQDGGRTWHALPALAGNIGFALATTPDGTVFTTNDESSGTVVIEKLAPGATAWTGIAANSQGLLDVTWNASGHPIALWAPSAGIQPFKPQVALSSLPYAPGVSVFTL
jgi:hypothetical protein